MRQVTKEEIYKEIKSIVRLHKTSSANYYGVTVKLCAKDNPAIAFDAFSVLEDERFSESEWFVEDGVLKTEINEVKWEFKIKIYLEQVVDFC